MKASKAAAAGAHQEGEGPKGQGNCWLGTLVKIVVSAPWYRLERLGITALRNAENPRIHASFRKLSPNHTKA